MNPVNQAQMNGFAEQFGLSNRSESDKFELYSIFSILSGGSGENVDPFSAHLVSTEFGLDGVAIIVQGTLVVDVDEAANILDQIKNPQIDFYFFQSKTSSSFDYGEVRKFFDAIDGFFDGSLIGESDQLDDLMAAKEYIYENGVSKKSPGVYCYFVTTGRYDPSQSTQLSRLIENTEGGLREAALFDEERITIRMVGAAELQRLYRTAATATQVRIEFKDAMILPEHPSVDEAYIGFIPATEILEIITVSDPDGSPRSLNKSVFFDNIRDYNPNSKINKEISEGLVAGEQANFVYRNNGITVVAKSVDRTGNNFTIQDFQVVNGCQTSHVLFYNSERLENVRVPFRLIGTKDEDFIFSIISGTNKQNPVRNEQFWSLLPFMKNLEEYARRVGDDRYVYLERRENQYRNEAIERSRIVQMQPFYKGYTAAILGLPHRSARNYKAEIDQRSDIIFSEGVDVRPAYASAYLHYRLEFLWRNQKIPLETKLYRYYIMDAAARQILGGKKVIGLKSSKMGIFADHLTALAADERRMKALVTKVDQVIRKQIRNLGLKESAREKLRDAIRTESFALAVAAAYTPDKGLV